MWRSVNLVLILGGKNQGTVGHLYTAARALESEVPLGILYHFCDAARLAPGQAVIVAVS